MKEMPGDVARVVGEGKAALLDVRRNCEFSVVEFAMHAHYSLASFYGNMVRVQKVLLAPHGRAQILNTVVNDVAFDVLCRGFAYYVAAISRPGDLVLFPQCRAAVSLIMGGTTFRGWHAMRLINLTAFRDRRSLKRQGTARILREELATRPEDEGEVTKELGKIGGWF
jgi:hypothetical protein